MQFNPLILLQKPQQDSAKHRGLRAAPPGVVDLPAQSDRYDLKKQKKHVEFTPDCSFNRNSEIIAGTGAVIDGHAFAAPNRPAEVLEVVYGRTWHVPREYW